MNVVIRIEQLQIGKRSHIQPNPIFLYIMWIHPFVNYVYRNTFFYGPCFVALLSCKIILIVLCFTHSSVYVTLSLFTASPKYNGLFSRIILPVTKLTHFLQNSRNMRMSFLFSQGFPNYPDKIFPFNKITVWYILWKLSTSSWKHVTLCSGPFALKALAYPLLIKRLYCFGS